MEARGFIKKYLGFWSPWQPSGPSPGSVLVSVNFKHRLSLVRKQRLPVWQTHKAGSHGGWREEDKMGALWVKWRHAGGLALRGCAVNVQATITKEQIWQRHRWIKPAGCYLHWLIYLCLLVYVCIKKFIVLYWICVATLVAHWNYFSKRILVPFGSLCVHRGALSCTNVQFLSKTLEWKA